MAQTPLTEERFTKVIDGLRETMTENTRTIIGHFNKSQGYQNERMGKEFHAIHEEFGEVRVRLDAITETLVMRQEMYNLIRELKEHGTPLDADKIFTT